MKPTRKTYPIELVSLRASAVTRTNFYGKSVLWDHNPNAARMWDVTDAAETCHGLRNIGSRFWTLEDCGRMAATFADTGVMT